MTFTSYYSDHQGRRILYCNMEFMRGDCREPLFVAQARKHRLQPGNQSTHEKYTRVARNHLRDRERERFPQALETNSTESATTVWMNTNAREGLEFGPPWRVTHIDCTADIRYAVFQTPDRIVTEYRFDRP